MSFHSLLSTILRDERLTRGLGDAEARILIEWLVVRTEEQNDKDAGEQSLRAFVAALCQRARAIARFVTLWCHQHLHGPAIQLAATERFIWPLPTDVVDPCDLMLEILAWEETPLDELSGLELT